MVLEGEITLSVVGEAGEGLRGGSTAGNCTVEGCLDFGGLDFSFRFGRGGPLLNFESGTGVTGFVLFVNVGDSVSPILTVDPEFYLGLLAGD